MTLIDTVVWISVFALILVAVTSSIRFFYRTNATALREAEATESAQKGVDLLMRTLREAGYSSTGAYPIISIAPNDVQFYAAVPGQIFVERVHLYVATSSAGSASLYEGITIPTGDPPVYGAAEQVSTISNSIKNLMLGTSTFSFFDQNGVRIMDMADASDVRFISAQLIVNTDPVRATTVTIQSSAALRNLVGK